MTKEERKIALIAGIALGIYVLNRVLTGRPVLTIQGLGEKAIPLDGWDNDGLGAWDNDGLGAWDNDGLGAGASKYGKGRSTQTGARCQWGYRMYGGRCLPIQTIMDITGR